MITVNPTAAGVVNADEQHLGKIGHRDSLDASGKHSDAAPG